MRVSSSFYPSVPRFFQRFSGIVVLLLASCGMPDLERLESAPPLAHPVPQFCFERHVIDASGSGADGVHLGDINQDGYPDVVSGWEESAELIVYLHPGASVSQPGATWKSIDVSGMQNVSNIEDAAFADLDIDGIPDAIVSATEGEGASRNRRIRIHQWDNTKPVEDPASWQGNVIFLDEKNHRFMKVRAAQLDGKYGADIVAATRELFEDEQDSEAVSTKGGIFLYLSPPLDQVADTEAWSRTRLADVHKGKSIVLIDMDADQDIDILFSGVRNIVWLENPGYIDSNREWTSHWIGTGSDLAVCDVNGDGVLDIVGTVSSKEYPVVARWFQGMGDKKNRGRSWQAHDIRIEPELPLKFYQPGQFALKSIACGHFQQPYNDSGPADIAITASGAGYGIFLAVAPPEFAQDYSVPWAAVPISPYHWIMKYDNILPVDMDADGDTDLVTSEENEGFLARGAGVLWYENKSCD